MEPPSITRQTSTALPLGGELAREAPEPRTLPAAQARRPLQWVLEGPGWGLLRPSVEFVLLWVAVIAALGGMSATLHVSRVRAPLLALPVLVVALFYLRGSYRTRLRALVLDGVVGVVGGVWMAVTTVVVIGLLANGVAPRPSLWLHAGVYALLAVATGRIALALAQRLARSRRLVGKPVLIMGAGLVGSQIARRLDSHPEYGLTPVGFLDPDPRSIAEVGGRVMPVLGTDEDLDAAVRDTGARTLLVAFSSAADARVSQLIQRCLELGIDVSVVPRMFDTINNRVGYDTVGGLPLMFFSSVNPHGIQFAIKYAIDRVAAAILLLLLSPLLLLIAIAVRVSTRGPVLFRQPRIGLDGCEFEMLKFRTMRGSPATLGESDADWAEWVLSGDDDTVDHGEPPDGGCSAADGDDEDRRTVVGRAFRSMSIDELPQLWNVLRGDMSLIGPRPERPSYVKQFEPVVRRYSDRHRVRSGMTGWAQVHGLRGRTSLAERVEWDNYYITHWSLGLDIKIVALTFVALFRQAE